MEVTKNQLYFLIKECIQEEILKSIGNRLNEIDATNFSQGTPNVEPNGYQVGNTLLMDDHFKLLIIRIQDGKVIVRDKRDDVSGYSTQEINNDIATGFIKVLGESKQRKITENFDNFRPQGYVTISNTGGIEVEVDNRGDGVRYRWVFSDSDEQPVEESEILYDPDSGEPYFRVGDMEIELGEVMKI